MSSNILYDFNSICLWISLALSATVRVCSLFFYIWQYSNKMVEYKKKLSPAFYHSTGD